MHGTGLGRQHLLVAGVLLHCRQQLRFLFRVDRRFLGLHWVPVSPVRTALPSTVAVSAPVAVPIPAIPAVAKLCDVED